MEYTKGEWWIEFHDCHTTIEAESQTVCTDVSNCDAHLIAAAPDMYEALKSLEGYGRKYPCGVPFRDKIKIALAKAEGKGE